MGNECMSCRNLARRPSSSLPASSLLASAEVEIHRAPRRGLGRPQLRRRPLPQSPHSNNPGPSDALGRALAAALPSLPDAAWFDLQNSGLGEGAAAELRAAKAAAGSVVALYLRYDGSVE